MGVLGGSKSIQIFPALTTPKSKTVNKKIKDLLNEGPDTTLGIYVHLGEVDLKITSKAKSKVKIDSNIKRLEKQEKTNKEKGELVYQNYQLIDSILKELKDISKNHSWKEIKDKLKGHKLIKEVISKDKSIVLELK